ncbi:MAG TPA: Ig-like domain-containing protein [Solirubrobacteraceae bacterium]|nr:Ig-like domain-containing protein [Solirubrobacteraceae bacterium]
MDGNRWLAATAMFVTLFALTAVPAGAATTGVIAGSPLTIYADDNGQLQVAFNGSTNGEFSSPVLAPAKAGLNLAVKGTSVATYTVFGFQATPFTPQVAPTVAGDGSPGNPFVLSTTYTTTTQPVTTVTQRVTYVNGTTDVRVDYQLDALRLDLRAYEAADLFVAGNDTGAGFFDPGPPRQVGGINQAAGSSAALIEQTPAWSAYQEGFQDDVFAVVRGAGAFNNTINPALLDDGVGVQWDLPYGSGPAIRNVSVVWRFKHFTPLQLSLAATARAQGQTATVTVSARNSDGNPDPGRAVRYAITGANPGSGAVTTGADGNASITWTGVNQGTDTFTAFTDLNGNGVRDGDEPQQATTVTWSAPLPPVPGKSVVAKVASGTVFVKYPPGYVPRAVAPAKGFVPFKGAANVPVGTQLDTKHGRVTLTSAADTGGKKTQAADFYQGVFQIKQSLPKKKSSKPVALITDLVMKGQIPRSECAPLKRARAASVDAKKKKRGPKSTLGKLWGNGKGKFRTTGKYSSATVRGTIWLVQDRCDGTLTRVSRGTVSVRDFKRKKTVTVEARHSYLASALSPPKKKRRG